MPLDIIVGAQWGDEGKGRIVDLLADSADYVARYSGGNNAGHTVTVGDQTFKLNLIPSGIVQPHTVSVLGNGMVINPRHLLEEMSYLQETGITVTPDRMRISFGAHLITPVHIAMDIAQEEARGEEKIGTTLRGIGPAYMSKVGRYGLRMGDMLDLETFADKVKEHVEYGNFQLKQLYGAQPLDPQAVAIEYMEHAQTLQPYITDVSGLLTRALTERKRVLAEGAQGTLLDLDHGTYPFVTSSNPTAPGALIGLGVGIGYVNRVVGVTKAFQTRVGEGPFPTEVDGQLAEELRGTGENPWDEFGTTTGRPRRVGWLDMVLLRYAIRVNGLTELVLTKLDVLSGLDTLNICVAYQDGDTRYTDLPLGPQAIAPFQPIYESFPGWHEDITDVRSWNDLPLQAVEYICRIEEEANIPVSIVSVGPEREQVIIVNE